MGSLNLLSATEIARRVTGGEVTAEAVVRDCLAQIEARESTVHAWAGLDPELALREARARDRAALKGPLQGVPVGVKDIIDTADMATEMGSPIYRGFRPRSDAACVALARAAGAVILGKTVTAEFAGMTPGATVNPHDPRHTPGGSSSGSAAGVADFMMPLAFGTQTGGSVLRPSSFCGITGFKPTFGRYNRAGVKPAAESLDTVGLLARTIEDIELLDCVLVGRPLSPPAPVASAPTIGVCRTHLWHMAQPETVDALQDAAARLAAAGASVREVNLATEFAELTRARELINNYERARAMAYEWHCHRDLISPRMQACIQLGLAIPYEEYAAAMNLAARCRVALDHVFDTTDIIVAPCVPGEAPAGHVSGGDPRFQELWTLLHTPTITLPTHGGPNGLPVGIQLVGRRFDDARTLQLAHWVWSRLGSWKK